MKKIIKFIILKLKLFLSISESSNEIHKLALGKINSRINNLKIINKIEDIEFKIFSQFGDDGIIQYIVDKLDLDYQYQNFIEFGVEDYEEANTKFLLLNNNWSGLILDSSKKNIEKIKKNFFFWKFDLDAVHCFVTKENINSIIAESEINKNKIGILSIDIDGNDYWIWKEINIVDPLIVIIEFNSTFGFEKKISVPYKKDFDRSKEHYSNLYWGASLEGLKYLAKQKGYKFFTTNSSGNNAYFIKENIFDKLELKLKKNTFHSKFRESRDKYGKKNFIKYDDRVKHIGHMEVVDVETNKLFKISNIL